jgi:hypothetical protein
MGFPVEFRVNFRVEHHLSDALTVPEIYENDTTMVSPALYPSHKNHFPAHITGIKLAARVGSPHIFQIV